MARRHRPIGFAIIEAPPDPRSEGSLMFADPSTAGMTGKVHTHNFPESPRSKGEDHGYRSITGPLTPWHDRTGFQSSSDQVWASMNRKRGVHDDDEEES